MSIRLSDLKMGFKGDPTIYTVIAMDGDSLVGHASVVVDYKKKVQFLEKVFVEGNYRGQGIGCMLINSVIDFCDREKLGSVALQVNAKNQEVIPFYTKLGFFISFDYGDQILMTKFSDQ